MSIRDEINAHLASTRLVHLQHAIPGIRSVRTILVNQDVFRAVALQNWRGRERYRLGQLRADLDRFIGGERIAVMLFPRTRGATTYLKRLDPVRDEVWEIRSCDPKPGVRVLGRFSEPDFFIGLAWDFHENLRGASWEPLRQSCLSQWNALFPHHAAYNGKTAHEYVSNAFPV
jgi:hypothetical protein